MELLTEVREWVRDRFGSHERSVTKYYGELIPQDRARVVGVNHWLSRGLIENLRQELGIGKPLEVGVLGIGSIVRPSWRRTHPPEDIDLRVLGYQAITSSASLTDLIGTKIGDYLMEEGLEFNKRGYYGADGYRTKNHPGLPLHFVISEINCPIEAWVRSEREANKYFALLEKVS